MAKGRRSDARSNGLRPEYAFDYAKARPNRLAPRMKAGAKAIVLEPDVARVFNAEAVNRLLRSVLAAVPPKGRPGIRARRKGELKPYTAGVGL